MTRNTIPQGAREGFTSDLRQQEQQADRAGVLLQHAADTVRAAPADQPMGDRAQRYRGAATVALAAASQLMCAVGWLEAADAAEHLGLLESDEASS